MPHLQEIDGRFPNEENSRLRLLASIHALKAQETNSKGFPSLPALLAAGFLAVAACLLFLTSAPRHSRSVTAEALLTRAVSVERPDSIRQRQGVVFERVKIRSRDLQIEWPVYQDMEGRRKPHFQKASASEFALGARLAAAGIGRGDPLSVSSFKAWHDHLRTYTDNVVHSSSGLVTITTVLPRSTTNPILAQSITLRDEDLHPVTRTVSFSDTEHIEIAELEYHVLNWSEAPREWFDAPEPSIPLPSGVRHPVIAEGSPALSDSELDLAELQARLVLSRENADASEQIDLQRKPAGIVVDGLVSSDERKRTLQAALAPVPHVTTKLSTPQERELSAQGPAPPSTAPLKLVQSVSQPSPLFLYWKAQQRNPGDLPAITSLLMESSLRVSQQSRALRSLAHEFAGKQLVTQEERDAYDALWRDHRDKLRDAIAGQQTVIDSLSSATSMSSDAIRDLQTEELADNLDRASTRSMQLCRELTAGDAQDQRDAASILIELRQQSDAISAIAGHLSTAVQ